MRLMNLVAIGVLATYWMHQSAGASPQWPSYNRSLDSQRFSPLAAIHPGNVADLREKCELALADDGPFQSGPLLLDDTLYVTTAHTTVALGAADCVVRWRHVYKPEETEVYLANRGLAQLDGTLFRGTADGRILAIEASSGRELWRIKAADPTVGEFFSAAPIAWGGLVFLGPAGGDWGMRGRVMAFDALTGRQVWRFNTVPMGDEPGAGTWHIPDTAKRGGGGTWTSYTLDPATAEVFIPVANPAPDLNPDARPGDNLYTNSLVVLDAKTGKLKWYFQLRANDGFDWDASAAPMLYTDAAGRPRVALGTKDGHVYSIDRTTHRLIFKTPVTTISNADKRPTPEGIRACPGPMGGIEWNGPAYDPAMRYLFVGAVDWCAVYKSAPPKYAPPQLYLGTSLYPAASEPRSGWITALDATSGRVAWRYHAPAPVVSGVTATAGGVVFGGDLDGNLLAFDSRGGKVLLQINLGGPLAGGVITYLTGGRQFVAATAGNLSRGVFQTVGTPRLVVLTTGLAPGREPEKLAVVRPTAPAGSDVQEGKGIFARACSACHGSVGEGGTAGPPLMYERDRRSLDQVIALIKAPRAPMPRLYPQTLDDNDVRRVAAYVRTLP